MLNKANLVTPQALDLSVVAPAWGLDLERTELGASYQTAKRKLTQIFRGKLAKVLLIGALTLGGGEKLLAEDSIDLSPSTDPDRELFNPSEKNCAPLGTNRLQLPENRVEQFKLYQELILEAASTAPSLIEEIWVIVGLIPIKAETGAKKVMKNVEKYEKAKQHLIENGYLTRLFDNISVAKETGKRTNLGPRVSGSNTLRFSDGSPVVNNPDEQIIPACWEDLKQAVLVLISAEDQKFFDHDGADIAEMIEQFGKDLMGFSPRGASTISMQLVKFLWEDVLNATKGEYKNFRRSREGKILQALIAMALEKALEEVIQKRYPDLDDEKVKQISKEIIITTYLNTIFFGQYRGITIRGIEMAARVYYGVPVGELSLEQLTTLIKTIPAPANQNPWETKLKRNGVSPQAKNRRSSTILLGQIDGEIESDDLDDLPAELIPIFEDLKIKATHARLLVGRAQENVATAQRVSSTDMIPKYSEDIWERAQRIVANLGYTEDEITTFTVNLTLHRDAQKAAMDAVREQVDYYINDRMDGTVRQNQVQASQLVVDPMTGKVLAAVSSNPSSPSEKYDYITTNTGTGTIGSTMKPIAFAYGLERSQRAKEEAERLRQTAAELNVTNPNSAEAHAAQAEYEAAKNAIIDANPNMLLGNNRADSNFFRSPDENVPLIPQAEFFRGILEPDQLGLSAAQLGYSRLSYPFNLPNKTAWDPTNYDDIFTQNRIPAWVMLKHSDNLSAINYWLRNIYEAPGKVGNDFANWLSSEFQFSWDHIAGNSKIQPSWGGAFILGTGEFSAESLAYFYAAVTNGGQVLKSDWQLINSIEVNGKKVWEAPPPRFESVMSEQTAFLAHWMLQRACQEGTSGSTWRNLLRGKYQTCGAKTGTGANFSGATHAAVIDGLTVISRMMPDTREGLKSLGSGNSAAVLAAPMTGLTLSKLAENNVSVSDLLRPPAGHEYDQASRLWLPEQFSAGFSSAGTPSASGSDTRALPEDPVGYQRTDAGFFVPVGYRRTQTGLWQPPVGIGWERQDAQILPRFKETTPLRDFLQQLERELADFRRIQKKAAEKDLPDLCTVEDLAEWIQNDITQTLDGATENPRAEFSAENPKLASQIERFCSVKGVLAAVRGWFAENRLGIPIRLRELLESIEALKEYNLYSPQSTLKAVVDHEKAEFKRLLAGRSLLAFLQRQPDRSTKTTQEALEMIEAWKKTNSSTSLPIGFEDYIKIEILIYSHQSFDGVLVAMEKWFMNFYEALAILPRDNSKFPRKIDAISVPFYQLPTQPD